MSVFQSTRKFDEFFDNPDFRNYQKFRTDKNAIIVFDWLQSRLDCLLCSIKNHQKPALQGVIVDLEEDVLKGQFGWTRDSKDKYFTTMIGAMVRFLVEEHGYAVKRTGVPLRNNKIISTAATYM